MTPNTHLEEACTDILFKGVNSGGGEAGVPMTVENLLIISCG